MKRLACGDADALAEFYDRYSPQVLGLIQTIVRDRALAEDVLQEVFWQVWIRRETYSSLRGQPRAWLMMLARSRSIDARRARHFVARPAMYEPDQIGVTDPMLKQIEDSIDLSGPLGSLPIEEREVICLTYFGGLTNREIADALEKPLGTVKSQIRNGLRRLSQQFTNADKEPPS
ncbi:sigma-70 family RNA polymerase sigma factor [bacterium]|nr:sigma-70 family RNA polymerase sigma factor [bacterium]